MTQLFGNTSGLSPSATKQLQRIYRRRVPLNEIATVEMVRSLCEASHETSRQVGALVHRSGQIDYVIVGDSNRLMLPDFGRLRATSGRFRGLRLVHTHLHGEPLSNDDLVDLVRLRLDMVAALQLNPAGDPRTVSYAHAVPQQNGQLPYRVVGPEHPSVLRENFGSIISNLESEFARHAKVSSTVNATERAILVQVGVKTERNTAHRLEIALRELHELARTAGVQVVDTVTQIRDRIDPKFVLGKGKLEELIVQAIGANVDFVIFDNNLTPTQASNIAKHTDLKVIDRTQLILDIFAQRAQSRDGKLQVELAQLKYALPRLSQKDDSLSRLTGGIGGRKGPGETKLEIGRRRARERVARLEAHLDKLAKQRRQRRQKRGRLQVPVVAIVGYTNAGKSTLLNTLTRSDVLAEDKLFATLDPRSRRLRFPQDREVVLTDTVGLIRDMPQDLFAAFKATFEEVADADLILQVVDASDQDKDQHIQTTETMLAEIDCEKIPRIIVFNKADLLEPGLGHRLSSAHQNAVVVSALHKETTRSLLDLIAEMLAERWAESALTPESSDDADVTENEIDLDGADVSDVTDAAKQLVDNSMTTLDELLRHTGRKAKLA